MTLDQFNQSFTTHYDILVKYAEKKHPQMGQDLVHQAYATALENDTYKTTKRKYSQRWWYYKVLRELARQRHKEKREKGKIDDYRTIRRQLLNQRR